jgi:hypothetical protein
MMDLLPGFSLQDGSAKIIFCDKSIVLRVVGEKSEQRYFSLARQYWSSFQNHCLQHIVSMFSERRPILLVNNMGQTKPPEDLNHQPVC